MQKSLPKSQTHTYQDLAEARQLILDPYWQHRQPGKGAHSTGTQEGHQLAQPLWHHRASTQPPIEQKGHTQPTGARQ